MPKIFYILFIVIIIIGVLFFISYFAFNIYEVKIQLNESNESPNEFEVRLIPLNSFGWEIGFRHVDFAVTVLEGEDAVDKIIENKNSFKLKLNRRDQQIKLLVKSKYSLFENIIEIPINTEEK